MEKIIPFAKLPKKKQRELNRKKRGSWYGLSPVTRRLESSKAYNRRRAQKRSDDFGSVPFAIFGKWHFLLAASRSECHDALAKYSAVLKNLLFYTSLFYSNAPSRQAQQ